MSFIELFDFIIYQHLNKRTNILPLATSQIAHLCHQFNHVCTANLQFLSHVLKALFFNQNSPKMKLFLQKNAKLFSAGAPPPDPRASGGYGLCPQTPSLRRLRASPPDPYWPPAAGGSAPRPSKQPPPPPIANFWLRA